MGATIREPAVAGLFYPGEAEALDRALDELLGGVPAREPGAHVPKAIVTPHAGYVYSGPIAARAWSALAPARERITRVVILGPAHRVPLRGIAGPDVLEMGTPLGSVRVDVEAIASVPSIVASERAHEREHAIEVQLPFVKRLFPLAAVVPLAVGVTPAEEVEAVLDALWGGPETVIAVSSDLSHYLPYAVAREVDRGTASRIVALDPMIDTEHACGAYPLAGLLRVARRRGMRAEVLDLRSSGDTAGTPGEVVGYGAFAFHES